MLELKGSAPVPVQLAPHHHHHDILTDLDISDVEEDELLKSGSNSEFGTRKSQAKDALKSKLSVVHKEAKKKLELTSMKGDSTATPPSIRPKNTPLLKDSSANWRQRLQPKQSPMEVDDKAEPAPKLTKGQVRNLQRKLARLKRCEEAAVSGQGTAENVFKYKSKACDGRRTANQAATSKAAAGKSVTKPNEVRIPRKKSLKAEDAAKGIPRSDNLAGASTPGKRPRTNGSPPKTRQK